MMHLIHLHFFFRICRKPNRKIKSNNHFRIFFWIIINNKEEEEEEKKVEIQLRLFF
jgi:hypothetical protein